MTTKAFVVVAMLYGLSIYTAIFLSDVSVTMLLWGTAFCLSLWEIHDAKD